MWHVNRMHLLIISQSVMNRHSSMRICYMTVSELMHLSYCSHFFCCLLAHLAMFEMAYKTEHEVLFYLGKKLPLKLL